MKLRIELALLKELKYMGLGRHLNFCINVELFNDEYLFELKCNILGLKDNPSFP